MDVTLTKAASRKLLELVKELELDAYYDFDESVFRIKSAKTLEELKKLLVAPKLLIYDEKDDGTNELECKMLTQ